MHIVVVPILLGRGVRLWDGLEGLEKDYEIEATSSPSGVTHVTFTRAGSLNRCRRSELALRVVHLRVMKQKQYSSMPPEPSPGARKCSLSTMWLWPPTKGL